MCVKVKSFSPRRCACASVFVSHSSDYGPFPLWRRPRRRSSRPMRGRASLTHTRTALCVRGCAVRRCDRVTRCVRAPPAVHARTVICGQVNRGAPQPQHPGRPRARHAETSPSPRGLRCSPRRLADRHTHSHSRHSRGAGARPKTRKHADQLHLDVEALLLEGGRGGAACAPSCHGCAGSWCAACPAQRSSEGTRRDGGIFFIALSLFCGDVGPCDVRGW